MGRRSGLDRHKARPSVEPYRAPTRCARATTRFLFTLDEACSRDLSGADKKARPSPLSGNCCCCGFVTAFGQGSLLPPLAAIAAARDMPVTPWRRGKRPQPFCRG
ncbi:hypothetical protein MTO96_016247 [Rhipicephalus appendiculatus]